MATTTEGSGNFSFPEEEDRILRYWSSIRAFETSLELFKDRPRFTFYDGPPFATGLPHYGHILAGTIKDIVTRHACQQGFYVERRFGWDCHGLPVEYEIDKQLGITCRDDVMRLGIPAYNEACRGIVQRYTSQWEETVNRMGRWIEVKNCYKTMDLSFMESVWWVFKQLFQNGKVYRGFRVMPYSYACNTPLSNFEANSNYRDTNDPSVVVSFPLATDPNTSLLAWTTTPWTLPSNLALCVHPDFEYVRITNSATGKSFILMEKSICWVFPDFTGFQVTQRLKGSELRGLVYVPLFSFFSNIQSKGAFSVLADGYVTGEAGTGIVQMAPAFGEDDFRICITAGIVSVEDVPCPLDANCRFTDRVPPYKGMLVKQADKEIMKDIEAMGRLLYRGQITHSYPFCWRSDTPLIYRAVPSWFVKVQEIIPQLLSNNEKTYWVPETVGEKRFHNWLEGARDWNISRNRYWGTPLPIWASDDFEELICVGSIAELEKLTGVSGIRDLHRESIDHLVIPSSKGNGSLKRVDEVLDCWFESGSVPYAQKHFPFENEENFRASFPADFIGEGIDQTRGWFYTLFVLSTHLFNQQPFKNVIVNGLVLAADGKKMSKRLKNYPEPGLMFDRYGADALRLYLVNSPVVRGENLRFREDGVRAIVKDVFLPWHNASLFLFAQIALWESESKQKFLYEAGLSSNDKSANLMDRWILSASQNLISFVRAEMAAYRLYTITPRLVGFIEELTNWYIRFNRKRLKGDLGAEEAFLALQILFRVLFNLCLVVAPFCPFISESQYQELRKFFPAPDSKESVASVHFLLYPKDDLSVLNPAIERAFSRMRCIVEGTRRLREVNSIQLKTPLSELFVLVPDVEHKSDLEALYGYVQEELNVRTLCVTCDESDFGVTYRATPNFKILGQRLKGDLIRTQKAIEVLPPESLRTFLKDGQLEVLPGIVVRGDDLQVSRNQRDRGPGFVCSSAGDFLLALNTHVDQSLRREWLAREIVNRVQRLRKRLGLRPTDPIRVYCAASFDPESEFAFVFSEFQDFIQRALRAEFVVGLLPDGLSPFGSEECQLGDSTLVISISNLAPIKF